MTALRQRIDRGHAGAEFLPHTQSTYVLQVAQFARHFQKSPEGLGPEEIRAYQIYLTNERKLAVASILIAVAALRPRAQKTMTLAAGEFIRRFLLARAADRLPPHSVLPLPRRSPSPSQAGPLSAAPRLHRADHAARGRAARRTIAIAPRRSPANPCGSAPCVIKGRWSSSSAFCPPAGTFRFPIPHDRHPRVPSRS